MKPLLHEVIRTRALVCDGAMGTQLMAANLEPGGCGEYWNVIHPERILAIQRRYVAAGADCLITNTFGASRLMLRRHGHDDALRDINRSAVRIARQAFGDRTGWVLGDIGPLGAIVEPYGDLPEAEARAAYEEQAGVLVEAGVDAVIIETHTGIEETALAIAAARAVNAPCIIPSLSYDLSADGTFYVTMMGVLPDRAAAFFEEQGAHVAALNCGTGVDMAAVPAIVRQYREHCSLPAMAQPNAGLPVLRGGKAVYLQSPEDMADSVPQVLAAGASIIGSCCGSTPDHTAALRCAVDAAGRR